MGEGTVFNGETLPGPEPGPFGPAEGDVFNGLSLQGASSGGGSGSGGLGVGEGTLFPPTNPPHNGVTDVSKLTITAMTPGPTGVFKPYSQRNAAFGGQPPYTWELIGGALPDGTFQNIPAGLGYLDQITGNLLQTGPYSYTLQVTDSSGVVTAAGIGGGTYGSPNFQSFIASNIKTTGDDQLVLFLCVTSNASASSSVAEITGITTTGNVLEFTRVFHDASFVYSDSAGDAGRPVATVSVDIFTAPAPSQITNLAWAAVGTGGVSNGTILMFAINGLADINNPFDSGHSPSAFPNVAMNTSGSASAPTNTGITTSGPDEFLFGVTVNHTTGGGNDATPSPAPGWVASQSTIDNHGGSSGFYLSVATKAELTPQSGLTVTAGFTDNFWYQVIFAFVGAGIGSQQSAQATITGNITPVVPGSITYTEGVGQYFIVPPYNFLVVEMVAGSNGPSTIASTFGQRFTSDGSSETIVLTPADVGAPPVGGPIQYNVATGSPAGEITFSWS